MPKTTGRHRAGAGKGRVFNGGVESLNPDKKDANDVFVIDDGFVKR
jgi:hypothetical protein